MLAIAAAVTWLGIVGCSWPPTMHDGDGGGGVNAPSVKREDVSGAKILLVAAPERDHLHLSWSRPPEVARSYRIDWRSAGAKKWNRFFVRDREYATVGGLAAGRDYEVRVRSTADPHVVSPTLAATPRERTDCSDRRRRVFCSWQAADDWLADEEISFDELRCRGKKLTRWGKQSPNCHYHTADGEEDFHLIRNLDGRPQDLLGWSELPIPLVRQAARRAIWPDGGPLENPSSRTWEVVELSKPHVGKVSSHASAVSYRIDYAKNLSSRVTWFEPRGAVKGYAIYQTGHCHPCNGLTVSAETIDWLLERGWSVIHLDMPLHGLNSVDSRVAGAPGINGHDFDRYDEGTDSPLRLFMLPVMAAVELIEKRRDEGDPLLMMGRSGGGWTTVVYAALDSRIDLAIAVAGALPLGALLEEKPDRFASVGDFEQIWPQLYERAPYLDLMRAAGDSGALYIYNRFDRCCYRIGPSHPLIRALSKDDGERYVRVWVDEKNHEHSTGPAAYPVIADFLDRAWHDAP